ncbi:MAG: polymer-forming cytoskeletal protein [Chloroflexi bacterium]|nr:polymer-forming cytoskeletal protein [Chloroflexota bacterium]
MTIGSEKANGKGFFNLFRRGQAWREISGYLVTDIYETQPVAVAAGSTVVGNIFAPQVLVAGLLAGTAVAQEVTVQGSGQLWGDIFAMRFHLEPGGQIRGWINTLTEADCETLLAVATQPTEPTADTQSAPNGLQPEHHRLRDRAKLDALRQLQTETAVALAARAELEETFDQRLAEIAGEATNQLTLVREELKNARAELADWQQKAQDTSNTLQLRETQLDRQSKELALAQESLAQTNQDLEELREAYAQKEGAFKELTSAKIGVDTHLHEALNQVDTLTGRVHNIETALQASLVHSSDQEDALLRWQELAESTEARVKELEKELQSTRQQLEQSSDMNNMLRDQRRQIESDWTKAQIRLEDLQKQLENEIESSKILLTGSDETIRSLTELNNQLKAELEPLQNRNAILMKQMEMAKTKFFRQEEEIANLRRAHQELETNWQDAQDDLQRIREQPTKLFSSEQIEALKADLAAAEEKLEGYQEQVLWYQANLETSQSALKEGRAQAEEQAAQLNKLRLDLQAAEATMSQQQQDARATQSQFETEKSKALAETKRFKDELRQKQLQLEASEADLQNHLRETAQQGQQLAEIRSVLIERELQIEQLRQTVNKQQQFIKQMKQVTTDKINSLETALAQARKL